MITTKRRKKQMDQKKILSLIFIGIVFSGCVSQSTPGLLSSTQQNTIVLIKSENIEDHTFDINVFHDDEYNVTCWHINNIRTGEAGNCIPDSQLNITHENK